MTLKYPQQLYVATDIKNKPQTLDDLCGYIIIRDKGALEHMAQALNILESKGWRVISSAYNASASAMYVIAHRE